MELNIKNQVQTKRNTPVHNIRIKLQNITTFWLKIIAEQDTILFMLSAWALICIHDYISAYIILVSSLTILGTIYWYRAML